MIKTIINSFYIKTKNNSYMQKKSNFKIYASSPNLQF